MIEAGFASDKGIVRENNEDACLVLPTEQIYVIADGVGGNKSGEFASKTAVTTVADFVRQNDFSQVRGETQLADLFKDCVEEVNKSIITVAREFPDSHGMATTMVMCHIRGDKAYFVNVGDSRAYIKRASNIFQVTEDHSYVNTLIKLGVITADEAKEHERGNIITRAMGAEENVQADLYQTDIEDGDVIIMCTDGLYNEVAEERISAMIEGEQDMKKLATTLKDAANAAGGNDNVTVVCLKNSKGGSL